MVLSFLSKAIPNKATANRIHAEMQANGASTYELGLFYRTMLARQLWPSQTSLAEFFGVSNAQVSRHVAIARLPIEVVEAFGDPTRISFRVGSLLLEALDKFGDAVIAARAKQAVALDYRSVDDILEFVVANRIPTRQMTKVSVRLARDKKTLRVELPNMGRLVPYLPKLESFLATAILMFEVTLASDAAAATKSRERLARRRTRTPARKVEGPTCDG